MSTAARQALATAASSVEDISCEPYFRQSTRPGDASVRLDRIARAANGFGSMTTWQVVVWLPAGQLDAEYFIDDHLTDLLAALDDAQVGTVTTAQPVQMQIESGSAPALVVEVVRGTEE